MGAHRNRLAAYIADALPISRQDHLAYDLEHAVDCVGLATTTR